MNTMLRNWLPMILCCLPGVAVAGIVAVGIAAGGAILSGPLGLGLIVLAALACPISMGVTMWRQRGAPRSSSADVTSLPVNCCLPGAALDPADASETAQRLAALRERRAMLERELAELLDNPEPKQPSLPIIQGEQP